MAPPIYRADRLAVLEIIAALEQDGRLASSHHFPGHLYTALTYVAHWKLIRWPHGGMELRERGREILKEWRVERFARGEGDGD